jgi:methyl-accepting chemotaxis protein
VPRDQVRKLDSVRFAADKAAAAAENSAQRAHEVAEVAAQVSYFAKDGVGAAERATDAIRGVRDTSQSVTEAIRELSTKSEAIGTIVATIAGIAGRPTCSR